jgi:hypothetical protein
MRMVVAVLGIVAAGWLAGTAAPRVEAAGAARAATAPQARSAGDASLLPAESAVPGWKKAENSRVFMKADLYGYIDGGAEVFLEYGFDQLTLQKYRNGSTEFAVEIYRMSDPAAALGIYLMRCGKETPDPSFKVRHTLNRHQLLFQKNRYYVAVNNVSGADKLGPQLLSFGQAVAAALPADRPVPELQQLPTAGLIPGSVRLVRGPFTLQGVYTLGDGDILLLGGKITGVAGNYKDAAKGAYSLVTVTYPTPTAAKKALGEVQAKLDKYLKPVRSTATQLVFKDYENKFGSVTVAGRKLDLLLHLASEPK